MLTRGEDAKQRQEAISMLTLCRGKHISFGFFSSLSHSYKPFIPTQVQPRKFQLPLDQTSNTSFGVLLRPPDSVKLYRVLLSCNKKKKKSSIILYKQMLQLHGVYPLPSKGNLLLGSLALRSHRISSVHCLKC